MKNLTISVYGSHNAAIAMCYDGTYYVIEVERWLNSKNSGLVNYLPARNPQLVFDEITDWLLAKTDGRNVDAYLVGYADGIVPKFKYDKLVRYDHHTSHAATAFYQSDYNEMLIFTFDGGGDGAFFNVYLGNADGLTLLNAYTQDLGFAYMALAEVLADIKREQLSIGNLVYAGKLMGLCAYGTVVEDWVPFFDEFYAKFKYDGVSYIGGKQVMQEAMTTLMYQIGAHDYVFDVTRYSDKFAWDIAATSQKAFENMFFKIAQPYLDKYPDMPIGMSGGCALNVLLNTKLAHMRNGKVFVPPNTNDCGIAVGALLWYLKPYDAADLTYAGLPVMDGLLLSSYIDKQELDIVDNVTALELAGYISEGYIVGIIQGNSEHGSRALGNRSIICAPTGNMKDTLNQKVKNREWYRPFAPVVRLEDVNKYFDFNYESRHMTYAAMVRDEWRTLLPAVTHEDGTGRLQTVTAEQNVLLYDLITKFDKINGFGVVLNTSFNINGKPILSSLADAFSLLTTSKLDAVFYKNKLIFKHGDASVFKSIRDSNGYNIIPLSRDADVPIVCVIHNGKSTNKLITDLTVLQAENPNIVLIAMDEVCERVTSTLPFIKPFPLHAGKIYHNDRMQKYMTVEEMGNRLKLIWLREALHGTLSNIENFIVVDYHENVDTDNLLKVVDSIKEQFYANKVPLHTQNILGTSGFGIIAAKQRELIKLADIMEMALVAELAANTYPETEGSKFNDVLLTYRG